MTCSACGIHQIEEKIMDIFHEINNLKNNRKYLFLKAPYRIQLFNELLPNKPSPHQPKITWWSFLVRIRIFYADNFLNFENVIHKSKEDGVKSIKNCKDLVTKSNTTNVLT